MSSIYQNCQTDRQYRASTGLSLVEFNVLYGAFQKFYIPKTANPYTKNRQPVLTDKREALFFILHYYKAYPTLQNLGMYFGMSDFAASSYLELLKPCLKAALHQQVGSIARLFTGQEQFDSLFAGIEDIFIDVTEIPIERASSQQLQKAQFSGKKNFTP
jgi:hypothetical protein